MDLRSRRFAGRGEGAVQKCAFIGDLDTNCAPDPRQELQLFLSGKESSVDGYNPGWNVRYITELTQPISFYLRGEEYSAQIEAFGRTILDKETHVQNDFAMSAKTDAAIEMIRASASSGEDKGDTSTLQPTRRTGLVGRFLGR